MIQLQLHHALPPSSPKYFKLRFHFAFQYVFLHATSLQLTKYMKYNISWEASSSSVSQEIFLIF
jgi:hypothetical protein